MKISFPHMGQVTAYKRLLEDLGHEVVMPQRPTQRTFDLGVLNSPEFICYPSKVMAGTYIEACENGAKIIVSSGGCGPCRAGMYCEIHRRILKKLGYDTEVIIFDSFFKAPGYFIKQLNRLRNKTSVFKVAKSAFFAIDMIKYLDELEKKIKTERAYEVNGGDFDKFIKKYNDVFYKCKNKKELKAEYKKAEEELKTIPVNKPDKEKRLRFGIVGEIFVVIDSATNMNIESRLNALGVEVVSTQYVSEWVSHNATPSFMCHDETHRIHENGKKYTTCNCGGHHLGNIGWIEEFSKQGYDGIIHLMPFGCLPELVTRSMSHKLSEQFDIPILSMSIDEQNGEANTQTRLEAFVDLCAGRKRSKLNIKKESADKDFAGVRE